MYSVETKLAQRSTSRTKRGLSPMTANEILRDAAFVLEMTARVKQSILLGTPLKHEAQSDAVAEAQLAAAVC